MPPFAFDLPHAVVDGNVYRILSRFFGDETPIDTTQGKKRFSQLAQGLLDEKHAGKYNQAIMDFHVSSVDVKDIEGSITRYIDTEVAKFTDGIERRVGGAVFQAQSLMQNIWSLIDKDELIGYQIWHFNQEEIQAANGHIPLTARWASYSHGDWEVKGKLRIEN